MSFNYITEHLKDYQGFLVCECGNKAVDECKIVKGKYQRFRMVCKCGIKTNWCKTPKMKNVNWHRLKEQIKQRFKEI